MVIKTLPKVERWIRLANLLPEKLWDSEEQLTAGQTDELYKRWNQCFGRKPELARTAFGQHPRAENIYQKYLENQREGVLILEFREPLKRKRGRPSAKSLVSRFKTYEREWGPPTAQHLWKLVRSVRRTLNLIADATEPFHEKEDLDWTRCAPIELPPAELKPVIGFNSDGRGVLWPDPYRQFLDDMNGFELFRIRRCPVCSMLYFAARRDKGACSPRCLNVHRVRKFRSPDKQAQYEFNRKLKLAGVKPRRERQTYGALQAR
jgi:hypothetical protein